MALWGAVTLLCAEGVEYVPGGNGGSLVPHVKAGGAGRVADSLLVTRLSKFVSSANASGFDRALQSAAGEEKALNEGFWTDSLKAAGAYVAGGAIGGAIQQVGAVGGIGLARAAAAGATYALGAVSGVGLALAVGSVLLSLLLNARDIAAWVYRTRTTTAGWLEMQASFLEMNAATLDPSKRIPRERQEAYAARMRSLASHIKLDADMAERDAVADIRADDRALQAPAGPSGGAPRLI
jgi:uncharacterized protein YegJ (DUF2314 family)